MTDEAQRGAARRLVPAAVECRCGGDCRCRPGTKEAAAVEEAAVPVRVLRSLDSKLAVFDRHAEKAVDELVAWMQDHREDLIALARGRHVEGHYRYQDKGLFEHDENHLLAESAQELADAIVYMARRAHIRSTK